MKLLKNSLLALLLILLSASVMGCLGNSDAKDAMKSFPEHDINNFSFTDVEKIRSDDALQDHYDIYSPSPLIEIIEKDNVKYIAIAGSYQVISGEFNLQEIEEQFKGKKFESGTHSGVTYMSKEHEGSSSSEYVALLDKNKILIADSEMDINKIIDVAKGKESSLYDNDNFKRVLSKLSGFEIAIISITYDDSVMIGISSAKKNNEEISLTFVSKTASSDDAKSSMDYTRRNYASQYGELDKVKRDKDIIIVKVTTDIGHDFFGELNKK